MAVNGSLSSSDNGHFTAKAKAKIEAAQAKAARDFRSDVVTVPTESMMDVRIFDRPWFQAFTNKIGHTQCIS